MIKKRAGGDKKDALAGSLTGFSVRAIVQPLDVLKIRFQVRSPSKLMPYNEFYENI